MSAAIVNADEISTSVTCAAYGYSPATRSSYCSEGVGAPAAYGSVLASITYHPDSVSTAISLYGTAVEE